MRIARPACFVAACLACLAVFFLATVRPARADQPSWTGIRAAGLGGALRGAATGDAALALNPSGMPLVRSYAVEGAYAHSSIDNTHFGHVSIVDSTSAFNVAGGAFYTYLNGSPDNLPGVVGHQGGGALAVPIGDKLSLGVTLRYIHIATDAPAGATSGTVKSGFTFDAGATIRPINNVSLGLVGYGLNDLKTPYAPLSFGGGITVAPITSVLLAFDALYINTSFDDTRGNLWSLMGGGEYTFNDNFAVRAGGGHEALSDDGYVTGGLSALSDAGAIDLAVRRDVSGPVQGTTVGVSLRLFVPSP